MIKILADTKERDRLLEKGRPTTRGICEWKWNIDLQQFEYVREEYLMIAYPLATGEWEVSVWRGLKQRKIALGRLSSAMEAAEKYRNKNLT